MIPNAWTGFDFGLGEDVDRLRQTAAGFARDRIAPRADRDRSRQRVSARPVAATWRARPPWHHGRGGVGRRRHGLPRPLRGNGGGVARFRGGRPVLRRPFEPVRQPDPAQWNGGAETALPAGADQRQPCGRARHVGGQCRFGRGVDAHPRRPEGRPLRPQRRQNVDHQRPGRRCRRGLRQDRPHRRRARHDRVHRRAWVCRLCAGPEARQARHARLRHRRARLHRLRSAGRERARRRRQRRQCADVGPRLRAPGAGGRPARHHAGMPRSGACPMCTSASNSASRSGAFS